MNAQYSLGRMTGREPMSAQQFEALSALAWERYGILLVNPHDPRAPLTDQERAVLKGLGARRHGKRFAP
ncbi:MAG: hypothetical protein KBC46_03405 [Ferrovibrio sp.]|nr:hypothetical protein [Ferrovibrio sp.]